MTNERVTYEVMRQWIFNCYYRLCRRKIRNHEMWCGAREEQAYAYDQFDNAFDQPIERLMLEVLMLILDAGRGSEQSRSFHREEIRRLLAENDLNEMTSGLQAEEAEEFLADLKILGLISNS